MRGTSLVSSDNVLLIWGGGGLKDGGGGSVGEAVGLNSFLCPDFTGIDSVFMEGWLFAKFQKPKWVPGL